MEKAVLLLPGKLRMPRKHPRRGRKAPPGRVDPAMAKGGKLPPGTRRTRGGKEYIKPALREVEAARGGKV
jgi:hypothetical protein